MSKTLTAGIALGVHNALPYVQQTLTRVVETEPHAPLVVVDDASGPETKAWLREFLFTPTATLREGCHRVLLHNERQQLYTRTYNRAIRELYHGPSRPDAVMLLNSDVEIKDPKWLRYLLDVLEQDPQVGIAGYPDEPDGKPPILREVWQPEYITGHCYLLRYKMLEEIGVLCETDIDGRFSPELKHLHGQAHLGSDRVLSWMSNAAGWKTASCNRPAIFHPGGGQSWGRSLPWLQAFELVPLWEPNDHLTPSRWYDRSDTDLGKEQG